MCKRICDKCGSGEHIEQPTITGMIWVCRFCPRVLEFSMDVEASPTYLKTYEEAEAYAKARSYVNCPVIED